MTIDIGQSTRTAAVFESIDQAVGHTPLVRLNRITEGIAATVYVKLEYLNPGGSVKDRAARNMLDTAEAAGELRPGGVVVEATSGNTGIGLAAIAAARGYRTVVVVPDKSSRDKIALLRAYGAEVHVTPGGRPVGHPEHLRSVALRLVEEIPGAWFAGQYDNPANPDAHRQTTGPEIWAQTGGTVTHYVAGIGTGGTVSGAGEFLKEASSGRVQVVGADPETSVYGGGDGRAWYVESVGHYLHPETELDEWPESYHTAVIDRIERIPDGESLRVLHRLAKEEGLLLGGSSGTSIAAALRVARTLGPDDVVVVIAPDSGRGYLSKYFDDGWLGQFGFPLLVSHTSPIVGSLLSAEPETLLAARPGAVRVLASTTTVADARAELAAREALPVVLARPSAGPIVVAEVLGAVTASGLATAPEGDTVADHLDPPLPFAGTTEPVDVAVRRLADQRGEVLIVHEGQVVGSLDIADLGKAAVEVSGAESGDTKSADSGSGVAAPGATAPAETESAETESVENEFIVAGSVGTASVGTGSIAAASVDTASAVSGSADPIAAENSAGIAEAGAR
ncbi:PLP-dependent cysteine synthase family protein [Nocardia sp. NPDC058176]|uniref:PLP-dependent cysteine synthase family protein n=1 Tax=Nocardia sp. NPDC058176 TaxID=3346368 RepID=UPI0036DD6F1C